VIADRAYAELRERIVTLRLPPGSVLREHELMSDLEIGRTPLREAIKRLALENLVAVQPRSGTYVTGVDAADIVHISEVRAELEAQAAELAARRLDAATSARAGALLDRLRMLDRGAGGDALMHAGEAIHRLVWEASRNPYLVETLERYFALSLRIWYVVLDRVPGLGSAVVVAAVGRGEFSSLFDGNTPLASFHFRQPNTMVRLPCTSTRSSTCQRTARRRTIRSRSAPARSSAETFSRWVTRPTSCSMIGPASSSSVT
jgi:DNA-binding GntR family transcriptional regulator